MSLRKDSVKIRISDTYVLKFLNLHNLSLAGYFNPFSTNIWLGNQVVGFY